MNLLENLIENYNFTEPQNLEDDDILVLWTEITSGAEVFKAGETPEALDINAENYVKLSNFLSEGKKRKLFDDLQITQFEEFLFSIKKIFQTVNLPDKEISDPTPEIKFQCQFCPLFFSRDDGLKSHIDAVHNGVRYKCTGQGSAQLDLIEKLI
jgi:hypothetical protein